MAARILVVEDFDDIRDGTAAILSAAGYAVATTAEAEAALALLADGTPPDLLFTDVVLGHGMNGFELAQRAVRLWPTLKVLYATGYAWPFLDKHGAVPGSRLIMKPYRGPQLLHEIALALAGPERDGTRPLGG